MRHAIAVCACLILTTLSPACIDRSRGAPADLQADRQAIGAVLDDWHDAAAHADEARYFGHFATNGVFLGTDASERWDVAAFRAYAHPHFAKGRAWAFHAVRRDIDVDADGAVAWFDEDLATEKLGPCRGSGVLVREGGAWRIAQYNLTATIPNERFAVAHEATETATLLAGDANDPLADLAWLAGAWVGVDNVGTRAEEVWSAPARGMMLAFGRSSDGFFETLRLEARADGSVVYVANPKGGAATEFTRVTSATLDGTSDGTLAGTLVVENLAHDWPKRITYRRTTDGVDVRVEGDPGGPVETWHMTPAIITRGK